MLYYFYRYRYPASLASPRTILIAMSSIVSQLNISTQLQSFSRPSNFDNDPDQAFPLRYQLDSQDYRDLQQICKFHELSCIAKLISQVFFIRQIPLYIGLTYKVRLAR